MAFKFNPITGTLDITELPGSVSVGGPNNSVVVKNSSGVVETLAEWSINDSNGFNQNLTSEISTLGNQTADNRTYAANATENAPNNLFTAQYTQVNIDTDNDGFDLGTNGNGINVLSTNIVHNGLSDIGGIAFFNNTFDLGNGTDPIDVNGISYAYGFGQVEANVNISGPLQGYGFQLNLDPATTMDSTEYVQAFYDVPQLPIDVPGYTGYNSGPSIDTIISNRNYTGVSINPTIDVFQSNSGFAGLNVNGNLGIFGSGSYFHGLNVNPNIDEARYAAGINVSMDNVTVYPGVAASLVIQDLTIAADLPGTTGNGVTIEYTGGGTAGAEVVSQLGLAFSVQIEDGVSTAQNIADALNAFLGFTTNLNVTISGTASNPQNVQVPTNLTGGEDPGTNLAAYLDGNVEITGNLTFGGALSIGKLNAFASQAIIDGGGTPQSIHSLVSNPTVAASATIANGDTLGINTAMLLTVGDNASVTSSFVGVAALALPAVVNMGTGSTIDQVSGGTFAINLDVTATGGTIANLDLCRSLAVPNGSTTVTRMTGYKFDLPFGDPGTTTWGFYDSSSSHNYFSGDLLIGGTAGTDDVVTSASIGLEIKSTSKAMLFSRMNTTERDALTVTAGMVIFNTSTSKLQVYDGTTWTDLH